MILSHLTEDRPRGAADLAVLGANRVVSCGLLNVTVVVFIFPFKCGLWAETGEEAALSRVET